MKKSSACLVLILFIFVSQRAAAQDTLQPGPQIFAQRDSLCKKLNAITPAGSSISFRLSENCGIMLVPATGSQVTSYDITTNFSGTVITTSYRSNSLSADQFYNMKKGQKFYIENIKSIGSNGGLIRLKPVTLTW